MGLIEKTVGVMKLDQQIKASAIQSKVALEGTGLLISEVFPGLTLNLSGSLTHNQQRVAGEWDISGTAVCPEVVRSTTET